MSTISETFSPQGTQALMYTPEGRDLVIELYRNKGNESLDHTLTYNIQKERLKAMCVSPNLFTFDTSLIKSFKDYYKGVECMMENNKDPYFVIFIIILVLILFVALVWSIGRLKR